MFLENQLLLSILIRLLLFLWVPLFFFVLPLFVFFVYAAEANEPLPINEFALLGCKLIIALCIFYFLGKAVLIRLIGEEDYEHFIYFQLSRQARRVALFGSVVLSFAPVCFSFMYIFLSAYGDCIKNAETLGDYLYFSYVAFTTVGFGDLQPVEYCRGLAAAEAVTGYLLLGAFVASIFQYFAKKDEGIKG